MNIRGASRTAIQIMTASAIIAGASVTFAADPTPAAPPAPSKETREKLAAVHEKMAACLRSDIAFADCRSEMMASCQALMGQQGCPMAGTGMHDWMMKQPPATTPDGN